MLLTPAHEANIQIILISWRIFFASPANEKKVENK